MSDKPATADYEEAVELENAVQKSGLPMDYPHVCRIRAGPRSAGDVCQTDN